MPSPPKSKGTPDDLAEVERALSVLKGRHPEHERVRREDEERRAKRQAQLDAAARDEAKHTAARRVKLAGAGVVAVAALAVIGLSFRKELSRRAKLEQSSDPYRAMGFVVVDTSGRSAPERLEAKTEPGCLLVVSTAKTDVDVTLASGGPPVKGPSPLLLCTCRPDGITAVASTPQPDGGLSLLRIDAAAIGGSRAFPFLPFAAGTTARTDDACAEASLDAWIDAKRAPHVAADPKWLAADPRRAVLVRAKAEPLATSKGAPLFVVDAPKESCVVAVSDAKDDTLAVRVHGGARPVPPTAGAIATCAAEGATIAIEHTGAGEVNAVAVPAAAAGGSLGLREAADDAGIALAVVAVAPGDRAWDAKQALVGSAVPEALVTTGATPEVPPDPDARLVALSLGTPGALVPEPAVDVYSYCEPPLEDRRAEAVCIFSGPQRWKPASAEAVGGLARAKLPFWLFAMDGVGDPIALKKEADLVGLARRLRRGGFEPTTLEAMTELANGVEILGRSGEDAVVAVGVAPAPPYVFPYGERGAAWALTGTPPITPIKTLEKVTLTSKEKLPPINVRRTVVFRRATTK